MARVMQKRLQAGDALPESVAQQRWPVRRDSGDIEPQVGPPCSPHHSDHDETADERMTWLVAAIETEIIPRLMLAHQAPCLDELFAGPAARGPSADDVEAFARLVLVKDAGAALAQAESWRNEGVALEQIYLDLLAPTARRLGEMWEADLCDFTEVTVGLWRLQQVMYDLSPAFQSRAAETPELRRAMLVPAPGSQHTFGLFMVAEFFRRAGWQVWGEPSVSAAELVEATRRDWFDMVGLSVGSNLHIEGLASVILAVRKASLNPTIAVMVGGPVFVAHPEFLAQVGADATARDAPNAIREAENLLAAQDRRR